MNGIAAAVARSVIVIANASGSGITQRRLLNLDDDISKQTRARKQSASAIGDRKTETR